MAQIEQRRLTAEIEGDFVVFLIGMRVNKLWKVHKWWPVATAMPKMISELVAQPEAGMLGFQSFFSFPTTIMVQYWRSFEHLEAYARNKSMEHFPAWVVFNKRIASNGDVGIWHETFLVPAGRYESIYNNMPAFGLGKASTLVPASGHKSSAAGRVEAQTNPLALQQAPREDAVQAGE